MNITDIIFLLIFIGFPVIGIILSYFITVKINTKLTRLCFLVFVIHNILFLLGFSLKGDFIDYGIFSLEYFALCLAIFAMPKAKSAYTKTFLLVGIIVIFGGVIIGIIGAFMSNALFQGFKADKIFRFQSNDKSYETRRYSFGFAALGSSSYTFKTYKTYQNLPFEMKIDETQFFDSRTNLIISEQELKINLVKTGNKEQLVFTSTNGEKFSKSLD